MPSNGAAARRRGDRRHRARNAISLFGLAHAGVAFPSPSVGGDLVATRNGVARKFGRALDGASASADRRLCAMRVEGFHDPPPSRARAIFEMAVEAEIGHAVETTLDLIDRLVRQIDIADRKFSPFLEIDNEEYGYLCGARPPCLRQIATVAEKVSSRTKSHR